MSNNTANSSENAKANPMQEISGVYEICIGTRDRKSTIKYWEQFGFSLGQEGELSAQQAQALYGVDSPLRAMRLQHQDSDHGLIRIMVWDKPVNEGLEMSKMRLRGNRWGAMMSDDVLAIANHAAIAKAAGQDIYFMGPMWDVIYDTGETFEPFVDKPIGVRELMLIRPESRQFIFQRYNYQIPNYGKIAIAAHLRTSQFTHVGLIIQDDSQEVIRFYDEVLGLLRFNDEEWVTPYEGNETGRDIFQINPGEEYYSVNFDDPRSSKDDPQKMRSGRLKIIRYPESLNVPDVHELARPGSLGVCLYTYAVHDILDYYQRISDSKAKNITAVDINEFGERSFSFVAPDGYFWTLVEKSL